MKPALKINDYILENGNKKDNIIEFVDNDTTITFDIKKLILKRENKEIKNVIDFKKETIIYLLKENNSLFNIDIDINNISCINNEIIINYVVENELFNLNLKF